MSQSQDTEITEKKKVAGRAGWMALGTFSSRILGLLRESALAAFFPRTITDVFIVAFRLPNMFRRLLGEGSLATAFIPVFVDVQHHQGEEEAKKLASAVYTILLLISFVLTGLGLVFMEDILRLVVGGEGFMAVPGKFEMAVYLARIMFAFLILILTYAYFMAILNVFNIFGLPAFAPALLNLVVIVACFLPEGLFSLRGEVLAWAVLFGGFLQVAILLPALKKRGYLPSLSMNWKTEAVKKVFQIMIPSILGMGVLQLMALVNLQLASRLGEGSHSYINWADRILELPLSLFAVSLGTALLPTLSRYWSRGEIDNLVETAQHHMRLIFFVSIPSAVGLWVLAVPIVEVLYFRGEFKAVDVYATAGLVKLYALTLLSASAVRVLAPSFYAIKKTWIPALSSLAAVVFHLVLALQLMPKWGLQGIVASTVASSFLNLLVLSIIFRSKIGPFGLLKMSKSLLLFCVCAFFLFLVTKTYPIFFAVISAIIAGPLVEVWVTTNSLWVQVLRALVLFGVIGFAAGTYFLAAHFLRISEWQQVSQTLMRKLGRKN